MHRITSVKKIVGLLKIAQGWHKLKFLGVYFALFLKRKLGRVPKFTKGKELRFVIDRTPFSFWIKSQLDFDVLWDAVGEDQYEIPDIDSESIKTVFDLGSNVGATVIRFYTRYPNATIYAVEPDPDNFACLKQNVAPLDQERIVLTQAAVTDIHNSEVTFHIAKKNHWSSSIEKRPSGGEEISVKTVALDEFCGEHGISSIDIVKMDIEGAEDLALDGFQTYLHKVKYFIGEMHPGVMRSTVTEFLRRFNAFTVLELNTRTAIFKFLRLE